MIPIRTANMRAATVPPLRSRTTARAITIPTPPAIPWISRTTMSTAIDGATAHAADEIT